LIVLWKRVLVALLRGALFSAWQAPFGWDMLVFSRLGGRGAQSLARFIEFTHCLEQCFSVAHVFFPQCDEDRVAGPVRLRRILCAP
jgi:hypothetical protein